MAVKCPECGRKAADPPIGEVYCTGNPGSTIKHKKQQLMRKV